MSTKQSTLSNELCDFLEKPYGTMMSLIEVISIIHEYIRNNNLENLNNPRNILPDDKLKSILNNPHADHSYFTLPRSIKHHFN